jgi:hypothetical protein
LPGVWPHSGRMTTVAAMMINLIAFYPILPSYFI